MRFRYIDYDEKYREALCDMINRLYQEDPEGEPMSKDKISATIEQAAEYPQRLRIFMIINEKEQAMGYAIIQLIWSNEWGGLTANIDEMYVVETARGHGITTDFLNSITQMLPEVNRLTLEVTPSNGAALKLYERLGFEAVENRCMEKVI